MQGTKNKQVWSQQGLSEEYFCWVVGGGCGSGSVFLFLFLYCLFCFFVFCRCFCYWHVPVTGIRKLVCTPQFNKVEFSTINNNYVRKNDTSKNRKTIMRTCSMKVVSRREKEIFKMKNVEKVKYSLLWYKTSNTQSEEKVPLVEFMYIVFTRMPGDIYCRSLLLCLCDVFRALINSLVCGFQTLKVKT